MLHLDESDCSTFNHHTDFYTIHNLLYSDFELHTHSDDNEARCCIPYSMLGMCEWVYVKMRY